MEPSHVRGVGRVQQPSTTERIKQLMLSERLHPGDPMPTEGALCEALGVSRSNVREAIRTLAALDIVDVRHGHGTFVGQLSLLPLVEGLTFRGILSPGDDHAALRDVVQMRLALDLGLAEPVVAALKGTSNPDLTKLVEQMVSLADKGEVFSVPDREFHTRMLSVLPNNLIVEMVGAMWDVHTSTLPRLGARQPDALAETARAHGDMLSAAEAGDAEAFRDAVRRHYGPLLTELDR